MSELKNCLGTIYVQQTKFDRDRLMSLKRPHISPAPLYKTYPDAQTHLLPQAAQPAADLWQVMAGRRSRRRYQPRLLSLELISSLLWAGQGASGKAGGLTLRTSPSAGALYPVETYLQVNHVQGLEPGLYHVNLRDWCLETLETGNLGSHLAQACLEQRFMAQAGVNICWSAIFRRNMAKYGHRGLRYILMDVGHICQNVFLAAEALGLSACPVGAFFDEEVNSLFQLDGEEESMLYFLSVGAGGDGK